MLSRTSFLLSSLGSICSLLHLSAIPWESPMAVTAPHLILTSHQAGSKRVRAKKPSRQFFAWHWLCVQAWVNRSGRGGIMLISAGRSHVPRPPLNSWAACGRGGGAGEVPGWPMPPPLPPPQASSAAPQIPFCSALWDIEST